MKIKMDMNSVSGGAAASSLIAFFILSGSYLSDFGTDKMGPKSMALALISGVVASWIYLSLSRFIRRRGSYILTEGADRDFNRMLSTLAPIAITTLIFAIFNTAIMHIFDVDSLRTLLTNAFNFLFSFGENGFFKGFFFVFLSSLLWLFGIHGSDTLENVMQTYFVPGLAANQAAVLSGKSASVVLTKEFFDCFVLMGGCGATICLLIAILLFSKNMARRRLGLTAAFPMIFNINEMMVFGLPVIFNPIMIVPFLSVPLVCYSVSYLAVSSGLVPMITNQVEWTTPIILGGYTATGSFAGSILQIVNVLIGVLIYFPFVRILDKRSFDNAKREYNSFVDFFKKNEQNLAGFPLIERGDIFGDIAKGLCSELRHKMSDNLYIAYQPQYNYDGECVGVESLTRWKHPIHGIMYPPLVMKLAEDGGFLAEFEELVFERVMSDRERILEKFGKNIKISINVTGTTVLTEEFQQFCRNMNDKYSFKDKNMCIEVTEQATISFDENTHKLLHSLKEMGFTLAIDDFSMGQTSIHYLKDNLFDVIKLDGSLVRGLFAYENSREIISSIVQLASSLNLTILAEYVEFEEQKEALKELGCYCYQGYLYSPAVFLDENKELTT